MENTSNVIKAIKVHFSTSSKKSLRTVFLLTSTLIFAVFIIDDPSYFLKGPLAFFSSILASGFFGLLISCIIFFFVNSIKMGQFLIIKNKLQKNEHLKDSNKVKIRPHTSFYMRLYKFVFKVEVIEITEMNGKRLISPLNAWVAYHRPCESKTGRIVTTSLGNFFLPDSKNDESLLKKVS